MDVKVQDSVVEPKLHYCIVQGKVSNQSLERRLIYDEFIITVVTVFETPNFAACENVLSYVYSFRWRRNRY